MADERRRAAADVRDAMRKEKMMGDLLSEMEKREKKEMKGHHARLVELKLLKKELPETVPYHVLSFLSGKSMAAKIGEHKKEVHGMTRRGRSASPPPAKIRKF